MVKQLQLAFTTVGHPDPESEVSSGTSHNTKDLPYAMQCSQSFRFRCTGLGTHVFVISTSARLVHLLRGC